MDNSLKTFINLVMNENLVQAQHLIKEKLNEALTNALNEKYESFAPTIFEKWDAEKADKNKDGEVSNWEKASTEWAGGNDDETEDEEQSEEEEEGESEEEETEETDQDSEETDEEEKD
jgi:X-linked retinitis pigmentosa GTPase regulator